MFKLVLASALLATAFALPQRLPVSPERSARILSDTRDILPDGSYSWAYETENGIAAQESGRPSNPGPEAGTAAQGSYRFTSPEGVPVLIQYVADENGYQPTGDAIPTPPPIPPAIARSLEFIARSQPLQRF